MAGTNLSISKATISNWHRLGVDGERRLTRRANKTLSERKIKADDYVANENARRLLAAVAGMDAATEDIVYTLCVEKLKHRGIFDRDNVRKAICRQDLSAVPDINVEPEIWSDDDDLIGYVYQSMTSEGKRNVLGQYYTNSRVAGEMLADVVVGKDETLLDPCCGSGAFLLKANADSPSCLYGLDIDPTAVMIARTNLLAKYADCDFEPQIYCADFLALTSANSNDNAVIPDTFDYIYTNPPWGTDRHSARSASDVALRTRERSSMFLANSIGMMKRNGRLGFLLPTSLIKINAHRNIRKHILATTAIRRLTMYEGRFDGVFTDYFSLTLSAGHSSRQVYEVARATGRQVVELTPGDIDTSTIRTESLTDVDLRIVEKIESRRHDDLSHSRWALGIVTGDNRRKIKTRCTAGAEPIYRGRDVGCFGMREPSAYVEYKPETFQQCADEAMYRAEEKLIYRFIARYPIVAYDDGQRLCLNSANVLIPQVDGLTVKTVAALLNSDLYRYYYMLHYADIKILKGNLKSMPMPRMSKQQTAELDCMVDEMLVHGAIDGSMAELNRRVFGLFGITDKEQKHIKNKLLKL